MGRIKDLDAILHELPDFEKGVQAERERILKELDAMADECLIEHYYAEAGLITNIIEYLKNPRVEKEGS